MLYTPLSLVCLAGCVTRKEGHAGMRVVAYIVTGENYKKVGAAGESFFIESAIFSIKTNF